VLTRFSNSKWINESISDLDLTQNQKLFSTGLFIIGQRKSIGYWKTGLYKFEAKPINGTET